VATEKRGRQKLIGGAILTVCLIGLILYSGGFFTGGDIKPGRVAPAPTPQKQYQTGQAEKVDWPAVEEAVGTFRSRTEAKVEARMPGRVLQVRVAPGATVKEGDLLVVLDEEEAKARVGQARQALAAAQAAAELARQEYGRAMRLKQRNAVPQQTLDRAVEAKNRSAAEVARAGKGLEEARVSMAYSRVTAPAAGQVTRRLVEPGDMALPGRTLLVIETGGAMRLEARVREGLIGRIRLGQELEVNIPALNISRKARVEEIVPAADPATRTFLVKAALPQTPGLYSGMFGRLLAPVGKETVVLAPARALIRVGQLPMVLVKTGQGWRKVFVTLGRERGERVEVLSGLSGGETLALEAADAR